MEKKSKTVDRTVISVSLTKNDKEKLKELAAKNEMTASALLCKWIRDNFEKECKGGEK
jgi:hypothetical protein